MNIYELKHIFIEELDKQYGVNENLGRHLFDRWQVEKRCNAQNVIEFIRSEQVRQVFLVIPGINRAQNYSKDQLKQLGIELSETIDANKRIFKDKKYGFHWREKFNGMADAYTGLFELIKPEPEDSHLTRFP